MWERLLGRVRGFIAPTLNHMMNPSVGPIHYHSYVNFQLPTSKDVSLAELQSTNHQNLYQLR